MQQHKNMEKIMRTDFARFPDFWHDKHNQLIFSSILQVRIVDNRQELAEFSPSQSCKTTLHLLLDIR